VRVAKRIETLPPYLFAELDRKISAKRAEGVDVISLGVGDPDLPTPAHVVEAMREAIADPATHRYPSY
jgi:LL-diaminopimelate aminotransferase